MASRLNSPESRSFRSARLQRGKAWIVLLLILVGITLLVVAGGAFVFSSSETDVDDPLLYTVAIGPFTHEIVDWGFREVIVGETNDKFVVVKTGLEQMEQVSLTPRRFLSRIDLPDALTQDEQQVIAMEDNSTDMTQLSKRSRRPRQLRAEGLNEFCG